MSPLLKNVGLAFLAGFVSSIAAFAAANPNNPGKAAIYAAVAAAIYAGGRAAVGYAKETVSGEPFKVDTEAPAPAGE